MLKLDIPWLADIHGGLPFSEKEGGVSEGGCGRHLEENREGGITVIRLEKIIN